MLKKPRILLFDIETGFNVVATHSLLNKNAIPYQGILQERYIICASWKWLGEKTVHSISVHPKEPINDLVVANALAGIIDEADAIVAHYGDQFDVKFLNTRLVYWELNPLPPVVQIDTYKIAKSKFRFNSNRLDYLGRFLGLGNKIKTNHELWMDCMQGDEDAIARMVKYNKQDVSLLERVYKRLKPYVPSKINYRLFSGEDSCSECGSKDIQYRGYAYTKASKFKRFSCKQCGHWDKTNKAEKL